MTVLYEDTSVIVCLKPAGVLSEDSAAPCVPALLREQTGKPVYAVHRLDKVVGGVMVYSTCEKTTGKLTQTFHESGKKTYLAVVAGDPGDRGEYTDLLYHDSKSNKTFVVKRMRRGVREAKLTFERLATVQYEERPLSLVRIHLQTGRTHQIRTQFASRKMPLVGDRRYGSAIPGEVALWSAELSFTHPKSGQTMTFCHEVPKKFPFDLFGGAE